MRVKNVAQRIWASYRVEAVACVLGSVAIAVLVYFSYPSPLAPSDAIQIGTLVILVIVTVSYASATRQQAEASTQAVDIALRAEKNAAMPIIRLRRGDFGDWIIINYKNVGKGPALRVNVWVETSFEQSVDVEPTRSVQSTSVLAANEETSRAWRRPDGDQPAFSLEDGFEAIAEYADIHAQRFRSRVLITLEENDSFSFERVQE